MREVNSRKESGCRENQRFAQQHTGSPWLKESRRVGKRKTSVSGAGWVGGCPCRQLPHVSAQPFAHGTIPPSTAFRQKSGRAALLTSAALLPALLLGEIFQGTANVLSPAPAEEPSQPGRFRKPARGQRSGAGTVIYHSPLAAVARQCPYPGLRAALLWKQSAA